MTQSIRQEALALMKSAVEREIQHLEADLEEWALDVRDKRLPKVIAVMKNELARTFR